MLNMDMELEGIYPDYYSDDPEEAKHMICNGCNAERYCDGPIPVIPDTPGQLRLFDGQDL